MSLGRAGEPRSYRRFHRSDIPFSLAAHIPTDGAIAVGEAVSAVTADWELQAFNGDIDTATVTTYTDVVRTLAAYMSGAGVEMVCDINSEVLRAWLDSPATGVRAAERPTANMRALRRASAIALYKGFYNLGISERNVAVGLPIVRRDARKVAAFSAREIQRLKDLADYETDRDWSRPEGYFRTPVCLALALLGAQSGEVSAVRVCDVNLLDGTVRLHSGGTRYSERTVPIDDSWAWDALATRIAYLSRRYGPDAPDRPVAYSATPGTSPTFKRRSAATSMTLGKLIDAAGLKNPGKIRVASINEYVARRIFTDTDRIEAVAARMGIRSLDAAAHLVGYEWRAKYCGGEA